MDLKRLDGLMTKWVGVVGGFSTVIMFSFMSVDVIARYFLNASIAWLYEVTEYLMVILIYLGLAYCDTVDGHISIDFILVSLPNRIKKIIQIINHVLMLVFMVLLTRQAWVLFEESWRLHRGNIGAAHTPVAPSQFFMLVGCFVFALHLLVKLIGIVRGEKVNCEKMTEEGE